ncbi:hypothetical protein D3C78_1564870 [compost metagenome]
MVIKRDKAAWHNVWSQGTSRVSAEQELTAEQFKSADRVRHYRHSTAFIEMPATFHAHNRNTRQMAQYQFTGMTVDGTDGKTRQFVVRNRNSIFNLIR